MSNKKGYVIVEVQVQDSKQYEEYTKRSRPAVQTFGGRYMAVGAPGVLEGRVPAPRVIVVEFASAQKAYEFYNSAAYQQAREWRLGAAEVSMYVVEGVSPSTPA